MESIEKDSNLENVFLLCRCMTEIRVPMLISKTKWNADEKSFPRQIITEKWDHIDIDNKSNWVGSVVSGRERKKFAT